MPKRRVRKIQTWNGPSTWRYLGEYVRDFWSVSSRDRPVSSEGIAYSVGAATAFFGLPWPNMTGEED